MKTKQFIVEWIIEVDAKNKKDAARKALEIQRDPDSIATTFHVAELDEDGNRGLYDEIEL